MSQVKCPYCGSIQVKAMSNQPKKYPRPFDPEDFQRWQRGYDCKKCGNDFIITPPKPLGLFAKLCGYILLAIIVFVVYSALTQDDNKNTISTKEDKPDETQIIDHTPSAQQEDPLKQEFSKEAEEAAHAYIPPIEEKPHKSISDSQDQNDTLSIKTTIRGSN